MATGKKSSNIKVREIMSGPLVTIKASDDVLNAVRKMKKINIHRLPVMEEGKVVGLISLVDVAKTSPEMLDILEYRMKMKEETPAIKDETTAGICDSCDNYSERLRHIDNEWLCENCITDMKTG